MRQGLVATGCVAILLPGEGLLFAQTTTSAATPAAPAATAAPATPAATADAKLPADQLDSLVAPIALYPDTLLAQALVASTYPLEIVQLQQWLVKNKDLKGQALTDAVAKEPWDPAIQGMATIPDLVKRLADDIQWTTELGNAFLAQQSDVMDAVQRMRKKATDKGALATNEQQKVETKVVEEKTVIIVEQANPEVVYVPTYNPTVVYGPPPYYYSYPPVYYPPYTPGAAFVSFSVGVAVGAAFWGGGCGWGHNEINIDVDRNVNRNTNINNNGNRGNGANRGNGSSTWSHNSQHRGAAPYSNKATADKFSGSTRAQSGNRTSATQQSLSGANRSAGSGSRASSAGASASSRSSSAGSRSSSGNNIGSRSMPSSSSRSSGFSGGSSGFSGSSARASSSRGASSMGGRGGGGGRRR